MENGSPRPRYRAELPNVKKICSYTESSRKKMGEITQKWIQHESTSQKANKDLDINGTYFKIFQ
jgi:hypothetical protein